jgi:hypothetical protein
MAIIATYISEGIRAGQPVTLKVHEFFWRIVGQGQVKALSDFEIEIEGSIKLALYQGDLRIRVVLLDQDEAATSGPCSLQFNSSIDGRASYRIRDNGMTIAARLYENNVQIRLSRYESSTMAECKVPGLIDLTAYIEPAVS